MLPIAQIMIMKNLYYLLVALCLFIPTQLFAQMQQQRAIVKTHARQRLDGTTSKCEYVSSALVTIKDGAQLVSDEHGELFFDVDAKSCYYISSAYKQGYQVTDNSIFNGHYYSGNEPLLIYMQNIAELDRERASYKRTIRSQYQNEINKRQNVIDSLRSNNLATQEELQALQQEVDKAWEEAENVISDMTERYLLIDFDYATDMQKRISTLILNGRLEEAKREINPESVEEKVRQVKIAQVALDNARDDAARYCMHLVDIYTLENKRDSVAHYLDLRASLDRSNIDWQIDAGRYIWNYLCDYRRALSIYEPALKYSLDHYGNTHSITASLLYNDIGNVYFDQGNYSAALTYFLKSLEIRIKVLGDEHENVATSYHNIGNVYYVQGNYSEALTYYFKALEIYKKVLGDEHINVAALYNNMGHIYSAQGNYSEALAYYFKSLEIRIKVLGNEHIDVASSYNSIGSFYSAQGNYSEALEYHFKSLEIRIKVLGDEHKDVATSYNHIGLLYYDQGNYSTALEYYFKSLEIFKKALGNEHINVATLYYCIGTVYYDQGNYSEALEYHFKSLEIFKKALGDEHINVATLYNNIGLIYSHQGNYSTALEYYFKSLEMFRKALGNEHINIAITFDIIGLLYYDQGNYSDALEYHFKSLEIFKKVLGNEHIDVATSYNNIGLVYYAQGNYSEALEYFTNAEVVFAKIYGEESEKVQQLRETIQETKNLL